MRRRLGFLTLFFTALLQSQPVDAVDGGQTVSLASYPHTLIFSQSNSTASISDICTGTLIAPRALLTAAHCVESFFRSNGRATWRRKIRIGRSFKGLKSQKVENVFVPSKYFGGTGFKYGTNLTAFEENYASSASKFAYDLAILIFSEDLTRELGIGGHNVFPSVDFSSYHGMKTKVEVDMAGFGFDSASSVASKKKTGVNYLSSDTKVLTKASPALRKVFLRIQPGAKNQSFQANLLRFYLKHNAYVVLRDKDEKSLAAANVGDSGSALFHAGKIIGVFSQVFASTHSLESHVLRNGVNKALSTVSLFVPTSEAIFKNFWYAAKNCKSNPVLKSLNPRGPCLNL